MKWKVTSMVLTLALLAGMLPTGAFAQTNGEDLSGGTTVVAESGPEAAESTDNAGGTDNPDAAGAAENADAPENTGAEAETLPGGTDDTAGAETPARAGGEAASSGTSAPDSQPTREDPAAPAANATEETPENGLTTETTVNNEMALVSLLDAGEPVTVGTLDDLQKAMTAAGQTRTTIQLTADITVDSPLAIAAGQDILLDLNGHTLSTSAVGTNTGDVIDNSGTLTVKNGTIAAKDQGKDTAGMAVDNLAGATLIIDQDAGSTTKLIGRSGVNNSGTVTVLNGTVTSYNRNAYYGAGGSTLLVEDGVFAASSGSSGMGRAISAEGNVTIHGGTFSATGSSGAGDNYMNTISMFYDGTLIIDPADGKTVTVTSETDYAVSTMYNAKVEIRGGSFACNGVRADVMDFESGNNVTITGGTFRHEPNTEFLGEHCVVVPENDRFTVKVAADPSAVTVNSYEELAAALNGDVLQPKNVTLGADVLIPADAALTLKTGYTLDVPAGKTLTLNGVLSLEGTMTNEGTLTMGGDGFLEYPLQLTNTGSISNFPVVENGVCRVSTPMQLQWLAAMVEWDNDNIPARIELANDIVMPDVDFTPIGNSEKNFYYKSTFDGCGHTVSNLQINVTTQYKGGFFGFIGDVKVQNLTVNGTSTNSTSGYIGAVAGYAAGDTTFQNVHVQNYTVNSPISYGVGGFVGQIAGEADNRVEFINCSLENSSVTGYANVGAFWGTSTGSLGTIGIYNCAVSGKVNAINVNGAVCGGYVSSSKVQIIGLDSKDVTLTVQDTVQPADKLLSAVEDKKKIDKAHAADTNTAIKNDKGEWVVQGEEDVGNAVASVNGVGYTSLTAALAAIQDGQTVQILEDTQASLTETYTLAAKKVALDLNGHKVELTSSAKEAIKVTGSLTVRDSSKEADGVLDIQYTGSDSSATGISVASDASLNLESGAISYNTAGNFGRAIYTSGSAALAMSGGTVKISGAASYALYLAGTGLQKITGGALVFDQNTTASTVYGVYGMTFGTSEGIEISGLTVDGTVVPDTKAVVCVNGYNTTTPVTISGGTYKANANQKSYAVGAGTGNKTAISDGTFLGPVKAAAGQVTGGVFSVLPSAQYLPEGKIFQKQSDGYYHIVDGTYVASVGDVGYVTWDELFAAVSGDKATTVNVMSDAQEIVIPEGKNVTLWNSSKSTIGKIVNNGTCRVSLYAMPGVQVENNGTFYLDQEVGSVVNHAAATMTAASTSSKVTGTVVNQGTMNISKGSYLGSVTSDAPANITGGTFAEDVKDLCAEGYTTQQNREGSWDVMAEGTHVAEINGYWYTSLADALKAARNGDVVKLLDDAALDTKVSIQNQNFTLDMNGHTVTYTASKTATSQTGAIALMGTSQVTITGKGTFTFDQSYMDSKYSTGRIFDVNNASVLTIENGTFHAGLTCVLADNNAEAIIKDGHFSAEVAFDGNYFLLNLQDGSQAKIRVFGGTFENYNPADSKTEPAGSDNDFCAPGYAAEETVGEDGSKVYVAAPKPDAGFVVKVDGLFYMEMSEAVKALKDGSAMTLLKKYEGDPVTISKSVTINLGDFGTEVGLFQAGDGMEVMVGENGQLVVRPETYTVTFETNGGSAVASQSVAPDTAATEPAAPARNGYTFAGWYSDAALTKKYDFAAPVTGNLTLYAKWTPVSAPESTAKPEQSGTAAQQTTAASSAAATPAPTAAPAAQPAAAAVIPQTSDEMPVGLLGGVAVVAAAAFAALFVLRKRKHRDDDNNKNT